MCPAIAHKTLVEHKWPLTRVQEESTKMLAGHFLAAYKVLTKYGAQATEEFDRELLQNKIEHYKGLGIKTPLDLIKAIAERESNVFGSKIEIWGEDNKASLTYQGCGMWNAMQKLQKMSPEMEETMGSHFEKCIFNLAKEFGWTGEVKFEEPCATVTIHK